jgi:hypothetical protein
MKRKYFLDYEMYKISKFIQTFNFIDNIFNNYKEISSICIINKQIIYFVNVDQYSMRYITHH